MTVADEPLREPQTMSVELARALEGLSTTERRMLHTIAAMSGALPLRIVAVFDALCREVVAMEILERRTDDAIIETIVNGWAE